MPDITQIAQTFSSKVMINVTRLVEQETLDVEEHGVYSVVEAVIVDHPHSETLAVRPVSNTRTDG